jgi:hypothetical protein
MCGYHVRQLAMRISRRDVIRSVAAGAGAVLLVGILPVLLTAWYVGSAPWHLHVTFFPGPWALAGLSFLLGFLAELWRARRHRLQG